MSSSCHCSRDLCSRVTGDIDGTWTSRIDHAMHYNRVQSKSRIAIGDETLRLDTLRGPRGEVANKQASWAG
ncbi:hypothetical protein E4U25_000416 [Claviceps purpurea]|nr:hypothetical protein E4U27_005607 [Claviceps purpurea]KAG6243570.1 hypothetical protein E4U25_000416 [Claviceps purpurea]KAG6322832.1 hypothetical protein E4U44_003209 [Claviceps purpurea]